MLMYSSGETFFPNCRTIGTMAAAEAPPYSSAVTREGRMWKEANSGGNEGVDSPNVLHSWSVNRLFTSQDIVSTYQRSMAFSASLPKLTLSRPAHTFTNQLLEKNLDPQPVVPTMLESKNVFCIMWPFGFRLRSFLKHRNTEGGMEPWDEG